MKKENNKTEAFIFPDVVYYTGSDYPKELRLVDTMTFRGDEDESYAIYKDTGFHPVRVCRHSVENRKGFYPTLLEALQAKQDDLLRSAQRLQKFINREAEKIIHDND